MKYIYKFTNVVKLYFNHTKIHMNNINETANQSKAEIY